LAVLGRSRERGVFEGKFGGGERRKCYPVMGIERFGENKGIERKL